MLGSQRACDRSVGDPERALISQADLQQPQARSECAHHDGPRSDRGRKGSMPSMQGGSLGSNCEGTVPRNEPVSVFCGAAGIPKECQMRGRVKPKTPHHRHMSVQICLQSWCVRCMA